MGSNSQCCTPKSIARDAPSVLAMSLRFVRSHSSSSSIVWFSQWPMFPLKAEGRWMIAGLKSNAAQVLTLRSRNCPSPEIYSRHWTGEVRSLFDGSAFNRKSIIWSTFIWMTSVLGVSWSACRAAIDRYCHWNVLCIARVSHAGVPGFSFLHFILFFLFPFYIQNSLYFLYQPSPIHLSTVSFISLYSWPYTNIHQWNLHYSTCFMNVHSIF